MEAKITPSVIGNYARLSYTWWHAIAEFIDNSTASYQSNRKLIDKALVASDSPFTIRIEHDNKANSLRIEDNAMGMDLDELDRAMDIGRAPDNTNYRNIYGMGLKTAACWAGEEWSIRTTKLGVDKEYTINFNVDAVASGELDLHLQERDVDEDLHYTELIITDLRKRIIGTTLKKCKDYLSSMYRLDTRDGLRLFWGDKELRYEEQYEYLTARDGTEYKKDFKFKVNKKQVSGWVGVIRKGGGGGRTAAGFAILHRNRMIQCQPDAWRPTSLFGDEASNDLVNQRLVGEIILDDFKVSQQKDAILWQDDEEEKVEKELKERFKDYAKAAKKKSDGDPPKESDPHITAAVDEVVDKLTSDDFVSSFTMTEPLPNEVAHSALEAVKEALKDKQPSESFKIGPAHTVSLWLSSEISENDPNFCYEIPRDVINVYVNMKHPHFGQVGQDAASAAEYLLHCAIDALVAKTLADTPGEYNEANAVLLKSNYLKSARPTGL